MFEPPSSMRPVMVKRIDVVTHIHQTISAQLPSM